MVSRKVFWGASNPFITGIFPAWCEILHQSLSRRMAQEESAKNGEGERADGSRGGPGAVLGPIRGKRMEGEGERVPAAAALVGASPRALGEPALYLQAQPSAGSLSSPLHLRQLPNPTPLSPSLRGREFPPSSASPPTPPAREEPAVARGAAPWPRALGSWRTALAAGRGRVAPSLPVSRGRRETRAIATPTPQEPVNKDPFVPAPSLSRGDRSPVGVVLEKGRRQVEAGTRPQSGAWEGAVPPRGVRERWGRWTPQGWWPSSGTPDTASAPVWNRVASS